MNRLAVLVLMVLLVTTAVFAKGTRAPLGSEENPIIWSFVPSGEMQDVTAGAQGVADLLHDKTGFYFKTNVATEYAGVIEALRSRPPEAHMASLATFAYIAAADMGVAEAALISVRYGSAFYTGQIIVRADSGIEDITDLAGKTFARPDPLSTSGWIIPMVTMKANGIDPETDLKEVVDAGSHDAVVAAVYNGDADAGATYVDARSAIEDEYPDVLEKVKIITESVPIPNDGVQFHPSVDAEMRATIVSALLEIIETEEGLAAMDKAYEWTALEEHGDEFYDPFRQVLQASGVKALELMKQ
jgi:phosphonate transport system substrate-binding protein